MGYQVLDVGDSNERFDILENMLVPFLVESWMRGSIQLSCLC